MGTVATAQLAGPPLANRAFYAFAVGASPADAKVIQGNVLPVNDLAPVTGAKRTIELPSVTIDVPAGESLFVLARATNDMFVGFGTRTPGAIVLQDAVVRLPVVR